MGVHVLNLKHDPPSLFGYCDGLPDPIFNDSYIFVLVHEKKN